MSQNIFQQLYYKDLESAYSKFTGIIFDNVIGQISDLIKYFENVSETVDSYAAILVSYNNPSWEWVLTLATKLGLRKNTGIQNWIEPADLENILTLSGFTDLKSFKRFFGITVITTAIKKPRKRKKAKDLSVSIIVPARNEAGNIPKIIPSIPQFGKSIEVIFIEGGSNDGTWEKILKETEKYKSKKLKVIALKQRGRGKADASWLGLRKAKGQILMIYDADRTVDAGDLQKFYNAAANYPGSFVNGDRLIYPMEQDAMRFLNKIGNNIFGKIFTYILGQRFKDTLCGTKVFYASDFKKFKRSKTDPFGDFDLIFGAIRNNLKIIDMPVRYKSRVYGSTNINRFYHGLLLAKMAIIAFKEFKLSAR